MSADVIQTMIARWRIGGLLLAAAGGALCASAALANLDEFLESYLLAYFLWWVVSLGCLGILMIYYLSGGRWGLAARPFLECGAMTMPLVAVMFLPIALELGRIYPWAPSSASEDTAAVGVESRDVTGVRPQRGASPQVERFYLNPRFFCARAGGYFVIWLGLVFPLCRATGRGPRRPRRKRRLAAAGLVLVVLTCTFAAIDWGMSLNPGWYSTMYGALVAIGAALAGLALVTAAAARLQARSEPHSMLMPPQVLADLGTLMLAFLMLWAYCAFSQYLIIWSGNLPEENVWYVTRQAGGWQWFGLAAVGIGFAVPFCLLLSRDLKHNPRRLAGVAMLVFVTQFVYLAWAILPSFRPDYAFVRLADVAAPVALGGIWIVLFASLLVRRVPPMHPSVARQS